MKCKTCEGKGFTELEHGLVMLECPDCKGTGEIDEGKESVLTEEMLQKAFDIPAPTPLTMTDLEALSQDEYIEIGEEPKALVLSGKMCREGESLEELEDKARQIIKARKVGKDDSDNGTEQADKPVRSRNPGKPKQPSKRKVKKQA